MNKCDRMCETVRCPLQTTRRSEGRTQAASQPLLIGWDVVRSQCSPDWAEELMPRQAEPSRLSCGTWPADFTFIWKCKGPRTDRITENKAELQGSHSLTPSCYKSTVLEMAWFGGCRGNEPCGPESSPETKPADTLHYFPNMPRGVNGKGWFPS